MGELPGGFEALEPYVATWAQTTTSGRLSVRASSTMEELRAFYDAAVPQAEAALVHLDRFDLADLPAPERRLLDLLLSLAAVALSVEKYGRPEVSEAAVGFALDTSALG